MHQLKQFDPRPNAPLILRAARSDDVRPLMGLLRRSWLTAIGPGLPAAIDTFLAEDPAAHYAAEMWTRFTIAEQEGRPAGMLHVQEDTIASIHVDPGRKGEGIGGALMNHAERQISRVADEARLEVLAFNAAALGFYRRRGWTERRRFAGTESGQPVELIELRKRVGHLRIEKELER